MRARRHATTVILAICTLLLAACASWPPSDDLEQPRSVDERHADDENSDADAGEDAAGDRDTAGGEGRPDAGGDRAERGGDAGSGDDTPTGDGAGQDGAGQDGAGDDAAPGDPGTDAPAPGPVANTDGRLLFGVGPTADSALASPVTQQAPVRMLTTWYNGPKDLEWLRGWRDSLIPQAYADGFAHHVIVFSDDPEGSVSTSAGQACGRGYPVSERIVDDLRELADIFAGGPLYVTMFTEFQTFPCQDNQWAGSETYYEALKATYLEAVDVFHRANPEARVALGWGGWQSRWDDPATGAGRSLIDHFTDVMAASDYQAFQAMQSDTNLDDIRAMTDLLAPYGPVMVAHYQPDNQSGATFAADMSAIFTDEVVAELTGAGLFAFGFMETGFLEGDPARVRQAIDAVGAYGTDSLTPPG